MTKSEGSATGGDNAESLAEDLLKRFSDTQPEVKKEPISGKFILCYAVFCYIDCVELYKKYTKSLCSHNNDIQNKLRILCFNR